MARWTCISICSLLALGCSAPPTSEDPNAGTVMLVEPTSGGPSILVFSRTGGFRHESIAAGVAALSQLARQHGFGLAASEDKQQFNDDNLARFAAVVFLSTTGEILDAPHEAAFERYIASGHGFVGIHAAADCEYEWPFYGELLGAYFAGHSAEVEANVKPEPVIHPSVTGVPSLWKRSDEWYGFRRNPRSHVTVLLTVDEATYVPGPGRMGSDHPVAWYHSYGGGRAFYTALGHQRESYQDPVFLAHVLGGIAWAGGISQ